MKAREVIFSFIFVEVCELINEALSLSQGHRIDPNIVRNELRKQEPEVVDNTPKETKLARACRECWSLLVKPIGFGREKCDMCGNEQDEAERHRNGGVERAVYRAV